MNDARRPPNRVLATLCWTALVGYSLFIYWLSDRPIDLPIPGDRHLDKLLHLAAYAVYGGLAALALGWTFPGCGPVIRLLLAGLMGSLYGLLDEWHQSFVPGRQADALDWGADTLGALLGASLVALWFRRDEGRSGRQAGDEG